MYPGAKNYQARKIAVKAGFMYYFYIIRVWSDRQYNRTSCPMLQNPAGCMNMIGTSIDIHNC